LRKWIEADASGLSASQWQERYNVEKQLEEIYQFEEIQWQRRGGLNWILKGDSNNGYFHNISNGRKKKYTIFSLEHEKREIRDPMEIEDHVESYYKELYGPVEDSQMSLGNDFWIERGRLTDEEAHELIKPFTLKELEEALKDMDANASPGPDGIPVGCQKIFASYFILHAS
jgi:hypothetical protein